MHVRLLATAIIVTLPLIFHPGDLSAQRDGFVIGIGLGAGTSGIESGGFAGTERRWEHGLATDFKIGYAPSPELALYWSSLVSWFRVDGNRLEPPMNALGLAGIGATRFLEERGPLAYVDGSVGFASWATPFDPDSFETVSGWGASVGTGAALSDITFLDVDVTYLSLSDFAVVGVKVSLNLLSN